LAEAYLSEAKGNSKPKGEEGFSSRTELPGEMYELSEKPRAHPGRKKESPNEMKRRVPFCIREGGRRP